MADRISISCPSCGAGLKLADASRLGKKIKCPKCAEVFVAAREDEVEELEEIEELEDEEPEPKRKSQPQASRKGGKKGPAKKSSGAGLMIALIGGGVALLLVVAGVGLYAAGVFGGGNQPPAAASDVAATDPAPAAAAATTPVASTPAAPAVAAHGGPGVSHGAAVGSGTAATAAAAHGGAAPAAPSVAATTPATIPPAGANPTANAASTSSDEIAALGFEWFPAETEMILNIRVSDLWQAPLLSVIRDDPAMQEKIQQGLSNLGALSGFNPLTDVESLTLAAWELDRARPTLGAMPAGFGVPALTPPGRGPAGTQPKTLIHVQLKRPLPLADIDATIRTKSDTPVETTLDTSSAIPTLRVPAPEGAMTLAQTSPTSLLIGHSTDVDPLVQRGRQTGQLARFLELSRKGSTVPASSRPQIVMMMFPKNLPAPDTPLQTPPGTPAWAGPLALSLQRDLQGFGLALTVKGGVTIQAVIGAKTESGSQAMAESLSQAIESLGQQYAEGKTELPPFATELLDPLVSSLSVEDAGSAVRITAGIPDSLQTQLQQAPSRIMAAVMLAGMAGGGPIGAVRGGAMPLEGLPFPGGATGLAIPSDIVATPAKSATNLPDGASLSAKVYIKPTPPVRPADPPMQLAVALTLNGMSPDADFLQLGRLSFKRVAGDGRQTLKVNHVSLNLSAPTDGHNVLPLAAFSPSPDGEVLLGEALIPPPTRFIVNSLSSVEGSFIVRRGEAVKSFEIPEASSVSAETVPKDDDLKSAGVKLRRESGKVKNSVGRLTESLVVSTSKGHALADLSFVDSSGNPVPKVVVGEFVLAGNPAWRVYVDEETKLPEELTLMGRLIGNVSEESVSFKFEDLVVPPPPQNAGQNPRENPGTPTPGQEIN